MLQAADQQVLTMRTPGDDLHLGIGFLLSEGVISKADDVEKHSFAAGDPKELRADTLTLHLRDQAKAQVSGRLTRTHEIRSSCGICGLTDPDALLEDFKPLLSGVPRISQAQVQDLRQRFQTLQPLFQATGACHGAVIFAADGSVLGVGEDVGRHNALDKAIGQASLQGHDLQQAIVMLSGRAGYDLVVKCLRLTIPVILSVSASSALSFDLCHAAGATLVGFLRQDRMQIYCDSGRITHRTP